MRSETEDSWYELTEGEQLEQGDILFECPVVVPNTPLPLSELHRTEISADIITYNVVGMTQSCDLENSKVQDVLLCTHWDLEEAKQADPSLAKKNALVEIKNGRRPCYTLLNRSDLLNPSMDLRIVDCRKVFCLPLSSVQQLAVSQGPRLRLRSPYREYLSQAFARFFMRIGLPQDIQI